MRALSLNNIIKFLLQKITEKAVNSIEPNLKVRCIYARKEGVQRSQVIKLITVLGGSVFRNWLTVFDSIIKLFLIHIKTNIY